MKFKSITSITAVLTFINAILFLVLPGVTMSILGGSLTSTGLMNTRISGACALGLSLVLWQVRDIPPSRMQTSISRIMLLIMLILVVVDLHGIFSSAVNQLGWIFFFTDFLVVVGFLFVVFTGTMKI
jgi:hypothetical protein